jgi:hypothetical protein
MIKDNELYIHNISFSYMFKSVDDIVFLVRLMIIIILSQKCIYKEMFQFLHLTLVCKKEHFISIKFHDHVRFHILENYIETIICPNILLSFLIDCLNVVIQWSYYLTSVTKSLWIT